MGKRLGLIIGINQYQDAQFRSLQYAENDARALAQWLVNVKGGKWEPSDVQHVQGELATHELLRTLIAQMCLTITAPDDLILIYFAGHTFIDERSGDGYMACANTRSNDLATAIHLPSLARDIMLRSRAAHILIILDCAQTGTIWQLRRSTPYDFYPLLASALPAFNSQPRNRLFLCSCRATDQLAETGERGLGFFMYQSIVGLCGPALDPATGTITLRALHAFLAQRLDDQHKPHLYGCETSPLFLVGTSPASSAPTSIPPASNTVNLTSRPFSPTNGPKGPFRSSPSASVAPTATATEQTGLQRNTSGISSAAIADQYRQQQYMVKLEQARQQLQTQNPTGALMLVEQVLQAAPQYQPALTLKAQILGTIGRFQDALPIVDQLLQMNNKDALAWNMRAVLMANSGQTQEALAAIERSLELDPGNAESYAIKNNIMMRQTSTQTPQPKGQPLTPTPDKSSLQGKKAALTGPGWQILALILGIIGCALLFLATRLPAAAGLTLQSISLALLCVNAARSTYHYGPIRIIFTIITSILAAIIPGTLLARSLSTRIFALLNTHPSLLMPLLFTIFWLVLVALLPFLAAFVGIVARLIHKPANRPY